MSGDAKAQICEDLSVFLLGGRVADAGEGLAQAVEAERLGFRGAWLCERFELKEAGAILGGAGASTSRLEIGTAPVVPSARPPLVTASMAATLQSMFPGRFTLGVGRGSSPQYFEGYGFGQMSYPALLDYCRILRRLWDGEMVTSSGPAGDYRGLALHDLPAGDRPRLALCHICGPRASKLAADPVFDGVHVASLMTPEALRRSVEVTKQECERIGRDPESVRITAAVAAAPELDDFAVRTLIGVRIAFGMYIDGESQARWNGWSEAVVRDVRNHAVFESFDANAPDQAFNTDDGRASIMGVTKLIPDSYIREVSAIGSIAECVNKLEEFKEAGAHEIVLYATNAAQNEGLIRAWRDR